MYLIIIFLIFSSWLLCLCFSNYIVNIIIYSIDIISFFLFFLFSKKQRKYNITEMIVIFSILYICIFSMFLFSLWNLEIKYVLFYLFLSLIFPFIMLLNNKYKMMILQIFNSIILILFCYFIYKNSQTTDKFVSLFNFFLNLFAFPFILNILLWIYSLWNESDELPKTKY